MPILVRRMNPKLLSRTIRIDHKIKQKKLLRYLGDHWLPQSRPTAPLQRLPLTARPPYEPRPSSLLRLRLNLTVSTSGDGGEAFFRSPIFKLLGSTHASRFVAIIEKFIASLADELEFSVYIFRFRLLPNRRLICCPRRRRETGTPRPANPGRPLAVRTPPTARYQSIFRKAGLF